MRAVLIVAFIVNLGLIAVTTAMAPPRVAIHFGVGGAPDNWASSWTNAGLFMGVSALLFAIFYFIPALVRATPTRLLSIPNRDYWTREENRERMLDMLGNLMAEFGVGMFVFFAWVEILTTMANLSDPVRLNEALFYPALVGFFVYTGFWLYRMFREFRVPETRSD